MDAAALYVSGVGAEVRRPAISITYQQFADAVDMLQRLNYPIEHSTDQAWPHFRGWGVNYDTVALALARAVDAPAALWSGDRRWPSTPIPSRRPEARQAGARRRSPATEPILTMPRAHAVAS